MIDISIIIVNRNCSDMLFNCLKSIFSNPCRYSFETIVVDNASTDNSVSVVRQHFKDVKLLENQTNMGFSAANNQAIKIAAGRFLLFLNSDTIVLKNAIDNLTEFLEKTENAGLCVPKLLNPDFSVQPNVYHFTTFRSILARYTVLKYFGLFKKARDLYRMRDFAYDNIAEIDRPMGAAMLAKKNSVEQIGLFDEKFFFYFEDADWAYRMKNIGLKNYFVPNAQIIHIGGASSVSLGSHKTDMMFYRSMFYYFRKYKGKFNAFLFSLIFKPLAILYYLCEAVLNFIAAFAFWIINNREKKQKLEKSRSSALFLIRYLPEFLFC